MSESKPTLAEELFSKYGYVARDGGEVDEQKQFIAAINEVIERCADVVATIGKKWECVDCNVAEEAEEAIRALKEPR